MLLLLGFNTSARYATIFLFFLFDLGYLIFQFIFSRYAVWSTKFIKRYIESQKKLNIFPFFRNTFWKLLGLTELYNESLKFSQLLVIFLFLFFKKYEALHESVYGLFIIIHFRRQKKKKKNFLFTIDLLKRSISKCPLFLKKIPYH